MNQAFSTGQLVTLDGMEGWLLRITEAEAMDWLDGHSPIPVPGHRYCWLFLSSSIQHSHTVRNLLAKAAIKKTLAHYAEYICTSYERDGSDQAWLTENIRTKPGSLASTQILEEKSVAPLNRMLLLLGGA